MKIFGFNLQSPITRGAPTLPEKMAQNDRPVAEVLPPFGTNPPNHVIQTGEMTERLIVNDPRELWYLSLPSKLTPQQVLQILRSGLGGDIWQQWQLLSLMMDSWPRFRQVAHQLREPVSQATFKVVPYCEDGEEPTDSASERASLVRRSFQSFKPNQFTDEEGFEGSVYDATDAVLIGLTLQEGLWQKVKSPKHGIEWMPRALAWVHPRHYTFGNGGVVAVWDQDFNRQYSDLARVNPAVTPDGRKFICSQFKSRSGSALGAGLMRPLAWWWSGMVFGREWRLKNAQVFGAPFVDVTYKPTMTPSEKAGLEAQIQAGLANRYILHVEGSVVTVSPAQPTGSSNSQKELQDDADRQCTELLLGQEGTTKTMPGSLGGKDESKQETKQERVKGVAKWVAQSMLTQLSRAILLMNYGEDSECPNIMPDFTEIENPMEAAQRMQTICGPGMPPFVADDVYEALKMSKPEPGDQVIYGGKVGLLGDTEQEIDPNPKPQPNPYLDDSFNDTGKEKGQYSVNASRRRMKSEGRVNRLRGLLSQASDKDIKQLTELVKAAESATHQNGEHNRVQEFISNLERKIKV